MKTTIYFAADKFRRIFIFDSKPSLMVDMEQQNMFGPYTYRESAKTQLETVAKEAKYLMEIEIIRHKNRWGDPDVI